MLTTTELVFLEDTAEVLASLIRSLERVERLLREWVVAESSPGLRRVNGEPVQHGRPQLVPLRRE